MADPNLAIANPIPQLPTIPAVPAVGAAPAADGGFASAWGEANGQPAPQPMAATTKPADAGPRDPISEFADAWKSSNNLPANDDGLTPVHDGGLELTDKTTALQNVLENNPVSATTLSDTQAEYAKAWLREHNGVYGDLSGSTPTDAPAPAAAPAAAPSAPALSDSRKAAWMRQSAAQRGPGDKFVRSLEERAQAFGITLEQAQELEQEADAEQAAQSDFDRRYAEFQRRQDAAFGLHA